MTKKKLLAVYGSLRKPDYNYNTFKSLFGNDFTYLRTTTIDGYDLYSLGAYPAINPGTGSLVVDLIQCSQAAFEEVLMMELGANYKTDMVNIEREKCIIFVYNRPLETNKIDSGDWIKEKYGKKIYSDR